MKINNCILLTCIALSAMLFTAFITPTPTPTPTPVKIEACGMFSEFLSYFEDTTLPFQLRLDDLKQYNVLPTPQKLSIKKMTKRKADPRSLAMMTYIPEITSGRFSRMGPPEVEPIARFYPTKKTVAVIYSLKHRFRGQLNKQYQMMVFNLKGKAVAPSTEMKQGSFPIAYTSTRETMTCQIDVNGRIWKNTYENIWKKNIKKTGINDNQLLGFKIKDTTVYNWNENGTIAKMKEIPTDGRASL